MDEWLNLDKAALELNEEKKHLLKLGSEGKITLTWWANDFVELFYLDSRKVELDWLQGEHLELLSGPKSAIRTGFFDINLDFCPSWQCPLIDIMLGGSGYGLTFMPVGPLAVCEVGLEGYSYSVTPPPELDKGGRLDFPTMQTLGVFKSELKRYKQQLLNDITDIKQSKMQKQANAILHELIASDINLKEVPQSRKKTIEDKLKNNKLFNADRAFKNAWQWLIDKKKISTENK